MKIQNVDFYTDNKLEIGHNTDKVNLQYIKMDLAYINSSSLCN